MALSPEEFARLKTRLGATASSSPLSAPSQLDGYGVSSNIKQAFDRRVNTASNAILSNQNPASKILQTVGQGAGFVGDVGFEALKAVTPDFIEQPIAHAVQTIGETEPVQNVAHSYQTWAQQHPEAAANLEAVVNIGAIMPGVGKSAELALRGAKGGTEAVAKGTAKAVARGVDAVTDLPSKARTWVQEPIKASVETALKETPVKTFDTYTKVARDANVSNKNVTPLEVAGRRAGTALKKIQTNLEQTGTQKAEVLKAQGPTGFQPKAIKSFRQNFQQFLNAKTRTEADTKLIRDIKTEFDRLGDTPSVGQVDRFIDFAQDRLYSASADLTVPVTNETTAALRNLVGSLNGSLKKQLPPKYAELNDRYAHLSGLRNELNTKLGKEGEKGGALMKRVFSPSDANTKKLFAQVLDETGIDLVNEATLARYLMDVIGDARQKSMLEQLNLSASKPTAGSITTRLIDYLVEKANSPEDLIRRARELTSGGKPSTP